MIEVIDDDWLMIIIWISYGILIGDDFTQSLGDNTTQYDDFYGDSNTTWQLVWGILLPFIYIGDYNNPRKGNPDIWASQEKIEW